MLRRRPARDPARDRRDRNWRGNQAHRTLLVDGFLAGVWKQERDTLLVERLGDLARAQRQEVTEGARGMPAVLHPGTPYDVRFAAVTRP